MKNYNKKILLVQNAEIIVGIDIGKNDHYACFLLPNGQMLDTGFKVTNDYSGYKSLENKLASFKNQKVIIGMEPTGIYWKSLGYYLVDKGFVVVLVNPLHTKLSKELQGNSRSKNDIRDSFLIASLVREGKYSYHLLLEGDYANLRSLTVTREMLTQEHVRAKVRLRSLISEFLPELEKIFLDVSCATVIALFNYYGFSGLKSANNFEEKINLIVKASRGKIIRSRAENIIRVLSTSIGVNEGIDAAEIRLRLFLEQICSYKDKLKTNHEDIKNTLRYIKETPYFLSIKGIGIITAGVLLGQTGSLDRYQSTRQIEKLAGLNIAENSSGKHVGAKHIGKRGRDTLRCVLYQIGLSLIVNNAEFTSLYRYKVDQLKR